MQSENKYRAWTRREERRLARLVADGINRDDIARQLGRSRAGIEARITRLGLLRDTRRNFSEAEDGAIRDLRRRGMPYSAIARRIGRSEGSVKDRARRLGLAQARGARGKNIAPRKCLKHGGLFSPSHRLEFVCADCKAGEDWQAGSWMG